MPFIRRVRPLGCDLPSDPVERASLKLDALKAMLHARIEVDAMFYDMTIRDTVDAALAWIDALHDRALREVAVSLLTARIQHQTKTAPSR